MKRFGNEVWGVAARRDADSGRRRSGSPSYRWYTHTYTRSPVTVTYERIQMSGRVLGTLRTTRTPQSYRRDRAEGLPILRTAIW